MYYLDIPGGTTQEDGETLNSGSRKDVQYEAVIVALHRSLTPALRSCEISLFKQILSESFLDIDVDKILDKNYKNEEFNTTITKLTSDDDEVLIQVPKDEG